MGTRQPRRCSGMEAAFSLSTISLMDCLVPFNLKLPPTKKVLAIFSVLVSEAKVIMLRCAVFVAQWSTTDYFG